LIATSAFGAIIFPASIHIIFVKGFAISQQITTTHVGAVNGKGTIQSVVFRLDAISGQEKCGGKKGEEGNGSKKHGGIGLFLVVIYDCQVRRCTGNRF